MKKPKKYLLIMQMIFTIIGIIASVMMLLQPQASRTSLITGISCLIAYAYLVFYSVFRYQDADRYFKLLIYVYAGLLGIQILENGHLMTDLGLTVVNFNIVNVINLFCFGCVIKFSDHLNDTQAALGYMSMANGFKFLLEFVLCIIFFRNIQLINIFVSLSVPIMGTTLLIAYADRYGE